MCIISLFRLSLLVGWAKQVIFKKVLLQKFIEKHRVSLSN